MTRRLTRDQQQELTKERVLGAAAKVFAKKGFQGASLEEIARAAGLTRGAIYSNFTNKEDLFFALMKQKGTGSPNLTLENDKLSPAEQIAAIAEDAVSENVTVQDTLVDFEFALLSVRDPRVRSLAVEAEREAIEAIKRWIDSRMKRDGLRTHLTSLEMAAAIHSLLKGIAIVRWELPELITAETVKRVLQSLLGLASPSPIPASIRVRSGRRSPRLSRSNPK